MLDVVTVRPSRLALNGNAVKSSVTQQLCSQVADHVRILPTSISMPYLALQPNENQEEILHNIEN